MQFMTIFLEQIFSVIDSENCFFYKLPFDKQIHASHLQLIMYPSILASRQGSRILKRVKSV